MGKFDISYLPPNYDVVESASEFDAGFASYEGRVGMGGGGDKN